MYHRLHEWHVDAWLPAELGVDREADRDVLGQVAAVDLGQTLIPLSAATPRITDQKESPDGP